MKKLLATLAILLTASGAWGFGSPVSVPAYLY